MARIRFDRIDEFIEAAHESGNWVICLDECIDKNLLKDIGANIITKKTSEKRIEIVGFGTGVGSCHQFHEKEALNARIFAAFFQLSRIFFLCGRSLCVTCEGNRRHCNVS